MPHLAVLAACLTALPVVAADRPDVLVADFEGDTYAGWTATGTAFGTGPAKGTLPGQMAVVGFLGRGLVNSYLGGDASTGTLTSSPFRVERKYLNFLIGGGKFPGKTCVDLLVDGKVVRTATGPNDRPGGSERLDWHTWDVAEFAGKEAVVRVVDAATGGWGHVNFDHLVQSDAKKQAEPARRAIVVDKPYLHLPVKNKAPMRRVKLIADGATAREFDIELAVGERPDFWAFADVSAFRGKTLTVEADLPGGTGLEAVKLAADVPDSGNLYREPLRPQFHFSSRRGWLNDPNGLVYHAGEWHLFYQHNPFGYDWGNMHWGHAVSRDLVHWKELGIALYPRRHGDWAFSGSAVVDTANTSGWGKDGRPPMVLAYTSTGRGECIAYSNDDGRTWTEFDGNPVVKHEGRDPKLVWHAPTKRWVMAVYDESDKKRWIAFYTSPDLKAWTYRSRIEGFFECPDLFELPVEGDAKTRKWVLTAADSDYMLGTFDGETFRPETPKLKGVRGKGFYAAQTFANVPDGRTVQIGWFQAPSPGMAFNQAMTVPLELKLLGTADGPRLAWSPAKELEGLRTLMHTFGPLEAKPGGDPLPGIGGELLDVRAEFTPAPKAVLTFTVRGVPVVYDAAKQELTVAGHKAAAPLRDGKQRLTILADRTGFEVFASDGLAYVPVPVIPKADARGVSLTVTGGSARMDRLDVSELKSIWGK
ncbi:MAG: 2,6-beta-D-fructofuranosidase [Gemmataceae bacterium]